MRIAQELHVFLQLRVSALAVGLFRVSFASLVLANGILLFRDRRILLQSSGKKDREVQQRALVMYIVFAATLFLGLEAQLAAAACLLCKAVLLHDNERIRYGFDAIEGAFLLALIFTRSGAALSLDAAFRGDFTSRSATSDYWPIALMQVQVFLIYLKTAIWKLRGASWRRGKAFEMIARLSEFGSADKMGRIIELGCGEMITWTLMGIELVVPLLLLLSVTRLPAVIVLMLFHLCLVVASPFKKLQLLMVIGLSLFLIRQA